MTENTDTRDKMARHNTTRRAALTLAAGLPLGAAMLAGGAGRAPAQAAPSVGPAMMPFFRFRLGAFEITPLLAATSSGDNPQGTFGMNASAEEFARVSQEARIPADRVQSFMTPVVVKTPEHTVLFDTGLRAEGIAVALASAGFGPEDIDTVVITHMHGDHIGGLMEGDTPTFGSARYITGDAEYKYWAGANSDAFKAKVAPLADRFSFLADGDSPLPGMKAILAPGHTPGHMVWRIESGGKALMLTADTANHFVWSLGRPDWEVRFDMDKPAAAASRHKVFGAIAGEGIPFIGYHMPFPAVAYAEKTPEGFRYVPAAYQALLG